MASKADRARVVAEAIVKLIDHESKYIPEAVYEVTGEKLLEYLIYAYECGRDQVVELGDPALGKGERK